MSVDTELDNAIDAAAAEVVNQLEKEDETPAGEEEITEESSSNEDEELTEDQLKEAKFLYRSLAKDPQGSVQQLMNAVGIKLPTDVKPETTAEVKAAKKAVLEILQEELPENLRFLAPHLGKGIEKILEQERQETTEIRQTVEAQRVEDQVVKATDELAVETKGESRKFEQKMMELADELQPGPGVSVKQYIKNLYTLASAGGTKKTVQKQLADKINRNANNAPERLSARGGNTPLDENNLPKGKMKIGAAVDYAYAQLMKQGGKK